MNDDENKKPTQAELEEGLTSDSTPDAAPVDASALTDEVDIEIEDATESDDDIILEIDDEDIDE